MIFPDPDPDPAQIRIRIPNTVVSKTFFSLMKKKVRKSHIYMKEYGTGSL
jgi:hypothetical protein